MIPKEDTNIMKQCAAGEMWCGNEARNTKVVKLTIF